MTDMLVYTHVDTRDRAESRYLSSDWAAKNFLSPGIGLDFKGGNSVKIISPPFWNEVSLRKQAYSNILKILRPKNENFQLKKSDIFHISAQNIDCGYSLESPRRGGSNEYPLSIILSRNKKKYV